MKMINKTIVGLATLTSLILSGCSGTAIHFEDDVKRKVNVENVDFTKQEKFSSSASGFQLLLFIPIEINSRHQRAYQDLRNQAGKDYLTNIRITESWTYAFVGTVYTTKLEATAYPYKDKD